MTHDRKISQEEQREILCGFVLAVYLREGKRIPRDRILAELSVSFCKLGLARFNSGQPLAEALDLLLVNGWAIFLAGYYWITPGGIKAFDTMRRGGYNVLHRKLATINLQRLEVQALADRSEAASSLADIAERGQRTQSCEADQIDPCPFCGKVPRLAIFATTNIQASLAVLCTNCYAQGPSVLHTIADSECKAEAIKRWNQRASEGE